MKLVLCISCQDIIRLFDEERSCKCGACGGKYEEKSPIYWGSKAIPISFDNNTLLRAIADQPDRGEGLPFEAKVLAQNDKTFIRKRKIEKV